jgi:YegS/Rv2252/BmrU family lipid kinase
MLRAARCVPLIANPTAGLGRSGRALPQVIQCLGGLGWRVRVHLTHHPEEAAELAQRLCGQYDRLLVVGGDGTIHSVLPALAGSQTALVVMPVGMSNGAARELHIPRSISGMCKVATGDKVRAIDLGCANGEPFLLMAGIGFDAAVVQSVNPRLKKWLGPAAYLLTALKHAPRARCCDMMIAADGRHFEFKGWLAVVSNTATYTYKWKAVPGADCANGSLDACIFEYGGLRSTAGQVMGAFAGLHVRHPRVRCLAAAEFEFDCDPPMPVQLDGDAAGLTPLRVTVMPQALRVLVP